MKNVKMTSDSLRKIITEEIKRYTTKKSVNKQALHEDSSAGRVMMDKIGELCDEVTQGWLSFADEGDPSIEATGKKAWEDQVIEANAELNEEIIRVIGEVEQRLINGEFHKSDKPFEPWV
jgi:hypothetical protein